MKNILEIRKVNKFYGDQIKNQVLFDINLLIEEGSFNAIIGASGSGKSTLLNIIGSLDVPTSGEILIGGRIESHMTSDRLAEIRNEVLGFIFQFHYLLPEFTALENVLIPYQIKHGKITKEAKQRALELLKEVGLEKVENNLASNLSGGEQQRVAIARALINNPKIILADEPTGNLDSKTTNIIYDILRNINKKYNTTFLIITHDENIAKKADRIIEIKDGKIFNDTKKD
ncbi:MAG: ABC transporter ATP-binding protein [Bacilli bacterium]|nr:ABC transporter ATP-binding protein [Bacilli bacterium]